DLGLARALGAGPPCPLPMSEHQHPSPGAGDPGHLSHVRVSTIGRDTMEASDIQDQIEGSVDLELREPRHVALGEHRARHPVGLPPSGPERRAPPPPRPTPPPPPSRPPPGGPPRAPPPDPHRRPPPRGARATERWSRCRN